MLKDSNPKQIWVPQQVQQTLHEVRQPGEKLYETVARLANAAKLAPAPDGRGKV